MKRLSIVVPVYYNQETLEDLYSQFLKVQDDLKNEAELEFIFVDDGSEDDSMNILKGLAKKDSRITLIVLSRNFGSFNAILAGLNYATGDCTAIISADLQDPPEMISGMFREWLSGNQTVLAVRERREDPLLTRLFSGIAYSILRKVALPSMPKGGFDFVLIDREIRDILVHTGESNTNLMGLILWVGFKQTQLLYTRRARPKGKSRWTFWKKVKYFVDSILAFSYTPIRLVSGIGIALGSLGVIYALLLVLQKIFFEISVPGWTAMMVVLLVLFGFQFLALGVIGEYLWRLLAETRNRPVFIVHEVINSIEITSSQPESENVKNR